MANKTMHHAVIGPDTFELVDQSARADVDQLKNAIIVSNAEGSIASFPDGGDGFPVRDLKVQTEPIQDLHGQANPYPPGGGKNLASLEQGTINISTGVEETSTTRVRTNFIAVETNVIYVASSGSNGWSVRNGVGYDASKNYVGNGFYPDTAGKLIITDSRVAFVRLVYSHANASEACTPSDYWYQFEKGSTATAYAPYSNICPISGRTAVTVTRTGVNIWDEELESGRINTSTGENTSAPGIRSKNFIPVVPSTTYYIKTPQILYVIAYDADKNYLRYSSYYKDENYTTQADVHYIRFYSVDISTYSHDISINYPSTDHDYHAYQGQSIEIQLGQTVYGGTLDVTTGVLTVDRAMVTFDGSSDEPWAEYGSGSASAYTMYVSVSNFKFVQAAVTAWSNYLPSIDNAKTWNDYDVFLSMSSGGLTTGIRTITSVADWRAYLASNPLEIVYELATPVTVQLTAQQLTTLLGQNNVWSDANSVSVDYVADTKLYIAKVIAEALS